MFVMMMALLNDSVQLSFSSTTRCGSGPEYELCPDICSHSFFPHVYAILGQRAFTSQFSTLVRSGLGKTSSTSTCRQIACICRLVISISSREEGHLAERSWSIIAYTAFYFDTDDVFALYWDRYLFLLIISVDLLS